MDILVVSTPDSERAAQFQRHVQREGHRAARITTGQRLPVSEGRWLGAIFFDPGAADLLARVRGLHEALRYLGVPLLVVTGKHSVEFQMQSHAAGAELVYDSDTPDAQILSEVISRCHTRAVAPNLRAQLVEPIINAVRQTLSQMAGADVSVSGVYQRETPAHLGDLSATLVLSHSFEGVLVMSFSRNTAEALARRILADVTADPDPVMVNDCMGEIANIAAGQAKALLAGTPYHFVFSTPNVTIGHQGMTWKDGMTSLVIAFDSDQGAFAVQVCRNR